MAKTLRQSTQQILMVRPKHFGFNTETAANNYFQKDSDLETSQISVDAIKEFDGAVETLRNEGIDVLVIDDTDSPIKTDAIFPNNWFSTHQNGMLLTYPMCAVNRRPERREDIIELLIEKNGYRHLHFEDYEEQEAYLESTGSMVLDRVHRKAYACLSERTDPGLLDKFCVLMDYENIMFRAFDEQQRPIYHTNVMMAVGTDWAIVCLDSIQNLEENERVRTTLLNSGKEIIDIRFDQMHQFLGNAIELKTNGNAVLCVMSQSASEVLTESQRKTLEKYARIVSIPIPTIETAGGGSIRCMIAEIF